MGTVPALTDETPLDQYISTASQTDFTFTFMDFRYFGTLRYMSTTFSK